MSWDITDEVTEGEIRDKYGYANIMPTCQIGNHMHINKLTTGKFFKKEDVEDQPVLLTIKGIKKENVSSDDKEEQEKWVLTFVEDDRGLVLNNTNIQLTARATGELDTDNWPGKKVVLYNDPNVAFGGKLVGGVRVRAPKAATQRPAPAASEEAFDDDIPF